MTEPSNDHPPTGPSTVAMTLGWLAVVLAASLPLYRPWTGLAAHAFLVLWFFAPDLRGRIAALRRHRLTVAALAFIALNLLSIAWSSEPAAGLAYVSKYHYLLLIPMLATSLSRGRRRLAGFAFIAGAALSAALSAAVYFGLFRIGGAVPDNPSPTMAHLDYSIVLAVASLLALVRALYGDGARSRRLAWFAGFVMLAAGLAINIGRSGQLGFAVGLTVLLLHWSSGRSPAAGAAVGVVLVVAVVGTVAMSPPAVDRVRTGFQDLRAAVDDHDYQSNVGGRLAALTVTAEIFRADPVLGTGVGANMPEFRRLLDTEFPELKPTIYWYQHLHNQYAQVATELGLAGLAALAWIFWELFRGPYRSRAVRAEALVVATVYLVGFVGEPFLHKQITLLTFALWSGLTAASQLEERAPADGDTDARTSAR